MTGKTWVPTSQPLRNLISSELVSVIFQKIKVHPRRFYRGHYITNPNNAVLEGKFIKIAHTFALFDPPKWVIS